MLPWALAGVVGDGTTAAAGAGKTAGEHAGARPAARGLLQPAHHGRVRGRRGDVPVGRQGDATTYPPAVAFGADIEAGATIGAAPAAASDAPACAGAFAAATVNGHSPPAACAARGHWLGSRRHDLRPGRHPVGRHGGGQAQGANRAGRRGIQGATSRDRPPGPGDSAPASLRDEATTVLGAATPGLGSAEG